MVFNHGMLMIRIMMKIVWALWKDVRAAGRGLLGSPGFSAVAVLSLALAIGVNTVIFTFVNALLLRPVPQAQNPDRLVRIFDQEEEDGSIHPLSFPNYLDLERLSSAFSGLAAYTDTQISLGTGERAELESSLLVTGDYFRVLGIRPYLGRAFLPAEGRVPGRDPVVVIGQDLWKRKFAADPGLLGTAIRVNGERMIVIGIAPKGFAGLDTRHPAQVWLPITMRRELAGGPLNKLLEDRASGTIHSFGRLKDGVTLARAGAEVGSLFAGLRRIYPEANKGQSLTLVPLKDATLEPRQRPRYVLGGILLMVVTGLVLLIACANVANLLLARAAAREKEIAIRFSLGARQSDMVRMLLVESLLLALAGGVAGLLLTVWPSKLLWALRPPEIPGFLDFSLDLRVLSFALLISLLTGLLFGLAPILRLSRSDLVTSLKSDAGLTAGRGGRKVRVASLLVVAEVALTLVPVVGSGILLRSLANAQRFDPGFDTAHQVVLGLDLGTLGYDEPRGREFYREALERVRAVPGVVGAGVAETLALYPSAMGSWSKLVTFEGEVTSKGEPEEHLIKVNTVSPSYFSTMGIPIRAGRLFDSTDRQEGLKVVVVNETLAKRFWPGRSAIGRRLNFKEEGVREVVGVVRNAKYGSLGEDPIPYIYISLDQAYTSPAFLHVRTQGNPVRLLPQVRRQVQSMNPNLGLGFVMPMTEVFERNLWAPRLGAVLLLLFGGLALGLAVLGIYGVIASGISQRRREISIRLAIGAQRNEVLTLMLRWGMGLVGLGLVLGLALSWFLGRSISALLFGLSGTDPGSVALAVGVLLLAGLFANLLAARRAIAVEPMEALRSGGA
jgi:macrolide transport system ATP-binding/permease protein